MNGNGEEMESKVSLRRRCLDARRRMPADSVAERSARIVARLGSIECFRKAASVSCYVSSKDNEVDTGPLIEALLRAGRRVLVPIAEPGGGLVWSRLLCLDELANGRFGILEPRSECQRPTVPDPDAVVIVPGIGFTREGHRIGYGGGYYDRFLAGHPGPKIALAFDLQMLDSFRPEPHDVPVDAVITETAVYWAGARGRS